MRYIRRLAATGERRVVWGACRSESACLRQLAANAGELGLRLSQVDLSRADEAAAWLDGIEAGGDAPREILRLAADKLDYMRFKDFDWAASLRQMELQLHSFIEIARRFLPCVGGQGRPHCCNA